MRFKLVESKEDDYSSFIAYHGSKDDIEEFDLKHVGDNIATDEYDINGIYFSPDYQFALEYAVGETGSEWTDEDGKTQEVVQEAGDGYVYKCRISPKNPYIVDNEEEYLKITSKTKDIIEKGYDIVIHTNVVYKDHEGKVVQTDGAEYIVLDPSIITVLEKTKHTPEEIGFIKKDGKWIDPEGKSSKGN